MPTTTAQPTTPLTNGTNTVFPNPPLLILDFLEFAVFFVLVFTASKFVDFLESSFFISIIGFLLFSSIFNTS